MAGGPGTRPRKWPRWCHGLLAARAVVDGNGRAFGYRNLVVCDGSIMAANPGVNAPPPIPEIHR
jgi:GMC oxidoreductase